MNYCYLLVHLYSNPLYNISVIYHVNKLLKLQQVSEIIMASKRHSDTKDEDEPESKRQTTIIPPASMGAVSSLEEMDIKVLQFQNKQLTGRLETRKQEERELQQRIESLEAKQSAADATISLVNRHWSQLDDNIKVILQRLGIHKLNKSTDNQSDDSDDESKASFVRMLAKSDFTQLKEELGKRADFSRTAFGKVIDAIEEEEKRREAILNAITANDHVDDRVKEEMNTLSAENSRYQELLKQLHAKHHKISMDNKEVEQKMESMEDEIEELKETNENLQWELQKAKKREDKLNKHLAEAFEKISKGNGSIQGVSPMASGSLPLQKTNETNLSVDENQILADTRLKELEEIKSKHAEALKQVEQLNLNYQNLPEARIVASSEYQTLKAQFSLLYHECAQVKQQADESRALLQQTRNTHLRQIEQMEVDELQTQKNLRNELIQLEDTLAKVRHDYEMLHMEFEQNLAANEQAGPINREMRHLINSLQNHNRQLKGEIQRYKRKVKDLQTEVEKMKEDAIKKEIESRELKIKTESSDPTALSQTVKTEPQDPSVKTEESMSHEIEKKTKEITEMKSEIESLNEKITSQNALIETYQDTQGQITAEQADFHMKEKKLLAEIQQLKDKVELLEDERDKIMREAISRENELLSAVAAAEKGKGDGGRGSYLSNESRRKMKVLEETIAELRKNVASTKQEEEALLSEMDVTGQAFEDMQEQNIRLLQQLREKDDANFKLMSERIKANQIQKLLQEEKGVLQDQSLTLHTQVEAQNQVVRRLEEKERAMQTTIMQMEKEMSLRSQALELHKRKAFELSQMKEDLQRDLGKARERARIAEESVDRKIETIEEEHFKLSRAQEDSAHLRRKLERQKKNDVFYNSDEILLEEIKEYKTKLRCPCCNVNNKDAVLTKCFHVFCLNCIKTRYDTRQRKCPKCNAGFGGNDFHRIYIE
ncbi:E3 ubiquitin-protein ligase BRE1B-like [Styela clava]